MVWEPVLSLVPPLGSPPGVQTSFGRMSRPALRLTYSFFCLPSLSTSPQEDIKQPKLKFLLPLSDLVHLPSTEDWEREKKWNLHSSPRSSPIRLPQTQKDFLQKIYLREISILSHFPLSSLSNNPTLSLLKENPSTPFSIREKHNEWV